MDPNETLHLMRTSADKGDWESVAEHADALDRWLSEGGFLPEAWACRHDKRLMTPATPR